MPKDNRIPEIELMKAIAIVGMVFVHIYECTGFAFSINEGPVYLLGLIVEFMGGVISAGTFMFAMGWGIAFSEKATPKTCFDRFTQLILLGLFTNIFTQWIPMRTAAEKTSFAEGWYRIFAVDIYPFAALAMLYFALIKKIFQKEKHRIIVSAALLFVALAINMLIPPDGFSTGSNAADTLIGLFIRENGYSYFPFVTWIAFPIMGFGAGSLYRKMNSQKGFAVFLLLSGIAALIISVAVMKHFNMPNAAICPYKVEDTEYYAMNSMSIVCGYGVIAIEYLLSMGIVKLKKNKLPKLITTMSKNVMYIYVIQWIIIGISSSLIARLRNAVVYVILSLIVLAATYGLSILIDRILKKDKFRDKTEYLILK